MDWTETRTIDTGYSYSDTPLMVTPTPAPTPTPVPPGDTVVTSLIGPANFTPGDVITISGTATPAEKVSLKLMFNIPIVVSGGSYTREFYFVFPAGDKVVFITADNVVSLNVRLYPLFFYRPLTFVCLDQTATIALNVTEMCTIALDEPISTNNTAKLTLAVPFPTESGWTFDIKGKKKCTVSGEAVAGASVVMFRPGYSKEIPVDLDGNFSCDMDTTGIPGDIVSYAGGRTAIVSLVRKTVTFSSNPPETILYIDGSEI